jgi:hypothetical protein
MLLNDTQKINYLLSAVRPERSLASVYSQIQTCEDLQFRDEAMRADGLLHATHLPTKARGLVATRSPAALTDAVTPVLITSAEKRQNRGAANKSDRGCD